MKKKIIINIILTFGLCFLTHNIYKWLPNNITAIFFPVNESIWEHMKMLYTTFLITGFINYLIYKDKNNCISSFISAIFSIIIYLVMFLPFNSENMILIFTVLIIDIIISEIIRYWVIKNDKFDKFNNLAYILIILFYVIFGYLTYNPIIIDLFKDTMTNTYGINTYLV